MSAGQDVKKLTWWMLGIFSIAFGTLFLTWMSARVQAEQLLSERVNRSEARIVELEKQFARIDSKLDMLIEQTRELHKQH